MNCQTFKEAIVEVARGAGLGSGTAAAVEAHIEHCASCRAQFTRESQLTEGLRALAESTGAEAPSVALEERLMAAFDEQRQDASSPEYAARNRWIAAAAVLLLFGGAAALWRTSAPAPAATHAPKQVVSAGTDRPEAAAPQPTPEIAPSAAAPPAQQPVRPRLVPRRPIRAEGFVALPAAVGLPDFESGEIVRVEIPLASMPAYGIDIVPDAKRSPVEADLLIGQDGQARAIRLVTNPARDSRSRE